MTDTPSHDVDPIDAHTVTSKRFDELTTTELHDLLRLRCDVFVVEQACAYPELDGRDTEPGTVHHWIADAAGPRADPVIAAYLRSLTEPDGTTRFGRIVTAPAARGRGLAAALLEHVGATVPGTIVLDAQSHLADWYRRLGYEVDGAEFVEDGIPHVPMRRSAPPGGVRPRGTPRS
jgi:ElaA protein